MQQFARVLTDKGVVPVILKGNEHLDLRPVVSDITPDAIAGGALTHIDTAGLSPIGGDFTYLAPIVGIRQITATGIDEMVAYFSTHMALLPGDLLATGTPPGVGFGKNRYMAVGDVLECGIADLGSQKHEIRA